MDLYFANVNHNSISQKLKHCIPSKVYIDSDTVSMQSNHIFVVINVFRSNNNAHALSRRRCCWQCWSLSLSLSSCSSGLSLALRCWRWCWCRGGLGFFCLNLFRCFLLLFLFLWFFCRWETALPVTSSRHKVGESFHKSGENTWSVTTHLEVCVVQDSMWVRDANISVVICFRFMRYFVLIIHRRSPLPTRPSHPPCSIFYFWISSFSL